jgi:hypothetical protein
MLNFSADRVDDDVGVRYDLFERLRSKIDRLRRAKTSNVRCIAGGGDPNDLRACPVSDGSGIGTSSSVNASGPP